jgi:diaminopimelate decarboxylase
MLRLAAARWGTPLYVTDLDRAAANLAAWQRALPGGLVAYAVKANADPALLRRLVADGAGCEVVTDVELTLALRAGCPPERVVMNGVGRTDRELTTALRTGALVNAESLDDLDAILRLADAEADVGIGLRLNPGFEARTHPHLATGAASAKFGIALEQLPSALERLRARGHGLAALGAHIGSDIEELEAFGRMASFLGEAARVASAAGLRPGLLDLGGGLRRADAATLDAWREAVSPLLDRPERAVVEPGRSIVADAGWLLTRVVRVQPRPAAGLTYLVADAGMSELIRPMLYGAEHPASLVADGAELEAAGTVALAGPVCEAGDVLVQDLGRHLSPDELRRCGTGALLAIAEAGAYGAVMASNYNGRLRPAQVVVEDGEPRLSRRRETVDDLLALDEP